MKNGKNIVLITASFPYGRASANVLRYFTFCLRDGGHYVEVFLPTGAFYGNQLDLHLKRKGVIEGIPYKRLGFIKHPRNYAGKSLDNFFGLVLPFFFLLHNSIKRKLDIIVVYNPTLLELLFHFFNKLVLGKKLIIMASEFYEKPAKRISISTIKWYNFYLGIKYFYKYADKYIVFSRFLKDYLAKQIKKTKDFLIMPNLTDPKRFTDKKIKEFKNGVITIGYVGTPTRKDGILDLIKCFSILHKANKNIHLLIIGDITNGKTIIPELEKFALEQGVPEHCITFTGLTSNEKVPCLLLSCQILALTRPGGVFAEAGFPTKLGEYFSCQKPVVITKVGDMVSYFKDKEHVVFTEPENIDSMVDAFQYLINNPEKAREIGFNGYRWMAENLNYTNQTSKISEFISR